MPTHCSRPAGRPARAGGTAASYLPNAPVAKTRRRRAPRGGVAASAGDDRPGSSPERTVTSGRTTSRRGAEVGRITSPRIRAAGVLVVLFGLGGCMMVGPDYVQPRAALSQAWLPQEGEAVSPGAAPVSAWWEAFADPVLDDLVERAYRQNPSLQAAGVRVLERAQLRQLLRGEAGDRGRHALGAGEGDERRGLHGSPTLVVRWPLAPSAVTPTPRPTMWSPTSSC